MQFIVVLGRLLYSAIFITSSLWHFTGSAAVFAASQGVPMANILVPISGIIALVGGLSILVGYKARWGAWLIVIFLIPVTFMMHKFWGTMDPLMHGMQKALFMKNLSMLGAAFLITYFGSGPMSIDHPKHR